MELTLRDHALDEMDCVTENESVSLHSIGAGCHSFNLETLQDRVLDSLAQRDSTQDTYGQRVVDRHCVARV